MDPSADKRSLGLLIAANPVGQLISSPLFGYLANRSKSIRMLCIATGNHALSSATPRTTLMRFTFFFAKNCAPWLR